MKNLQKILTLFISVGAVGGALMMWIDPSGTLQAKSLLWKTLLVKII